MGIKDILDRRVVSWEETKCNKNLMIHMIPGKPGILELAKLVETKILAQLAEDTEAESLHVSLSQCVHGTTGKWAANEMLRPV